MSGGLLLIRQRGTGGCRLFYRLTTSVETASYCRISGGSLLAGCAVFLKVLTMMRWHWSGLAATAASGEPAGYLAERRWIQVRNRLRQILRKGWPRPLWIVGPSCMQAGMR